MSEVSHEETKVKVIDKNKQKLLIIQVGYHEFRVASISKVVELFKVTLILSFEHVEKANI